MTDEERWKIEGRTRDALRLAKQRLGLLRADVSEHADKLKEASGALQHFLSDPVGVGPTGMAKTDYVVHFWHAAIPPTIEEKLRELAEEAERVQKLEKQISEFE
jgi:hypothetical protein